MSTVLVAGGATGIGAAVVRALRERGDRVMVADRNVEAATALVSEEPGTSAFFECDLADAGSVQDAVAAAVTLGAGSLDVVLYNAALLEARPLEAWTVEQWDRSMAVNLRAPFLVAQAAAPMLRKSEHGRLILTSSTGALRGHAGMPAYHASKAGVIGLVRALADELGPDGVTVNAVCPGWVDTPFNDTFWAHQDDPEGELAKLVAGIPLRRQAEPRDLTGLVLFLASEASAYITGQALVIDGGYTAV